MSTSLWQQATTTLTPLLFTLTCRGTSCAVAVVGTLTNAPGFGTKLFRLTTPLAPVGEKTIPYIEYKATASSLS